MVESLIETATSLEVDRFPDGVKKVQIPKTTDFVFLSDPARPVDIGPDHFLATDIVVEPVLGADEKRGPETVDVVGQVVTLNRPAVTLTAQEHEDKFRTVTYDNFDARFSGVEQTLIAEWLNAVNTGTGKPLQADRQKHYHRAVVNNTIDILNPQTIDFMDALVLDGVIDQAKRDEIMTI